MGADVTDTCEQQVKGEPVMVRVIGCSETPRLELSDLDTDKYKCIAMEINPEGAVVCVLMSRSVDLPHYRVVCGTQNMFYTNRRDAMDCMKQLKSNTKMRERGNK